MSSALSTSLAAVGQTAAIMIAAMAARTKVERMTGAMSTLQSSSMQMSVPQYLRNPDAAKKSQVE